MNRRFKNALLYGIPILLIISLFVWEIYHLQPFVQYQAITTYQFYDLIIKVIAATLTLCAVIVALFKEFFLAGFNYVDLKIENRDLDFIYEDIDPVSQPPVADSYKTFLKIINNGNILAEGCEIKVTEIKFMNDSTGMKKILDVFDNSPLKWNNDKDKIDIYPKNHTYVSAIILSTIENATTPGRNQGQNTTLLIGDKIIPKEYSTGKLEVVFELLYKGHHRALKYKLKIAWNGQWKSRSSDIKEHYSITPEINNSGKRKWLKWSRRNSLL